MEKSEPDKVLVKGHWKTNWVRGPKFGTSVWIEPHYRAKPASQKRKVQGKLDDKEHYRFQG